jgi:hypothetical protein
MTKQKQELCDVCHERPITFISSNGNTGVSIGLCRTCYEQTMSPAELESHRHLEQAVRNGKCQYCGGPASSGSMNVDGVKEEYTNFMCGACAQDLTEFASRPENALPDRSDLKDKSKEEQIYQRLQERKRRQEEFIRQRIRERQAAG